MITEEERMIPMPSIESGRLLSSVRETSPVSPVQRSAKVEEKKIPEAELQPIVPEEKAQDRYESSLETIDPETKNSMNSQTNLLSAERGRESQEVDFVQTEARVPVEQVRPQKDLFVLDPFDPALTVDVADSGKQKVVIPLAAQEVDGKTGRDTKTETVASRIGEMMRDITPTIPEQQMAMEERAVNPVYQAKAKQVAETKPLQMEADPEAAPTTQHAAYMDNATYTQNSNEFTSVENVVHTDKTELPVRDRDNFRPEMPELHEVKIREYTVEDVADDLARASTTWDTPVEAKTKDTYKQEVDLELQTKAKVNQAQHMVESAPVAVDPVYSAVVPEQRVETGPLPSVASIATHGAVPEAMAEPQEMAERYEPVEIQTQPAVEVRSREERVVTEPDTSHQPVEHTQAQAKAERPDAPVAEPIEMDLPSVELPEPEVREVAESPAVRETRVTEEASDVNVEDYFPELPGSGETATTYEEIAAPIAGSGDTQNMAEEYFAPLPGSGETVAASPEEYFAPLPGTSQVDGSGGLAEAQTVEEFMEENPLPGSNYTNEQPFSDMNEPSLQDFLGEGVSAISNEERAFRTTTGVDENYWTTLEEQFGGVATETEAYDPFQVQGEQWVRDSIQLDAGSAYKTDMSGNVDLSAFEENYTEVEDNSIELEEYVNLQMDRVVEYEIEESEYMERDLEDLFT